jgi:hypothetical protein
MHDDQAVAGWMSYKAAWKMGRRGAMNGGISEHLKGQFSRWPAAPVPGVETSVADSLIASIDELRRGEDEI